MSPFFLLHHAAAAEDGRYVERFFRDVQKGVHDRLGYREVFSGATAGAEQPGPRGPGEANPQALLTPVLVALYSDAYFADAQCRIEWSLFRERLRWHQHFTGRRSPALIGVRWSMRTGPPPGPIASMPVLDGDYGGEYLADGVLRMLRVAPNGAGYRGVVTDVVEAISHARRDQPPSLSAHEAELVERSGRTDWAHGGDRPAGAARPPDEPARLASVSAQRARRWRMSDPDQTRRPILRRAGARAELAVGGDLAGAGEQSRRGGEGQAR
ncbi:hypothetical protein [Frankia sp. AgKG'84/4]